MKLLVTGFEPFGKDTKNASLEVLEALPSFLFDWDVITERLPVTFGSERALFRAISLHRPDAVVCMGQAGGAKPIVRVERFALNIKHCTLPDNEGAVWYDTPIEEGAPLALECSLPWRKMAEAETGSVPAGLSYCAGTFVCNYTFYRLMQGFGAKKPAGFLHLPLLDTQEKAHPGMAGAPVEEISSCVVSCLEALIQNI